MRMKDTIRIVLDTDEGHHPWMQMVLDTDEGHHHMHIRMVLDTDIRMGPWMQYEGRHQDGVLHTDEGHYQDSVLDAVSRTPSG